MQPPSPPLFSDGLESGDFTAWDLRWNPSDVSIASNSAYVHSGSSSAQFHYHLCDVETPSTAAALGQQAGGSLAARTYSVRYSYATADGWNGPGETLASSAQSISIAANSLLTVASPPSHNLLESYNVYAGTSAGNEARQNPSPIPVGTDWTEAVSGLASGSASPAENGACGSQHQDHNRWIEKDFTSANGYPGGLAHFSFSGWAYFRAPKGGATWMDGSTARKLLYIKSAAGSGGDPNYYFAIVVGIHPMGYINAQIVSPSNTTTYTPAVQISPAIDVWHRLQLQVQANTPGASDGSMRLWFDGALLLDLAGLNLRDNRSDAYQRFEIGRQVDRGNWESIDEYRYWDDIVITE